MCDAGISRSAEDDFQEDSMGAIKDGGRRAGPELKKEEFREEDFEELK